MVTEDAQAALMLVCSFYMMTAAWLILKRREKLKRLGRRRRWWVREDIRDKSQSEFGYFVGLRRSNHDELFSYCGLEDWQFQTLLDMVRPHLTKAYYLRVPIPAEMRLAMTLRYLAHGGSMKMLSVAFRVDRSTAQAIVKETCDALWRVLSERHVRTPSGREWDDIATGFWERWNFPNCVGAIDGKHVAMKAPDRCGSEWYSYKGFHSMVLMAACDSKYRFTWVDCGGFGSRSDGGLFAESDFGSAVLEGRLDLSPSRLPDTDIMMPKWFVADAAFPLMDNIMRPYPGRQLPEDQRVFNYRLSRARRVIENAFGILVVRWKLLRFKLEGGLKMVSSIVLAAVALHNFCIDTAGENSVYHPRNFVDREVNGVIVEGAWRNHIDGSAQHHDLRFGGAGNSTRRGVECRDVLRRYFTEVAPLDWQRDAVNVGRDFFVAP